MRATTLAVALLALTAVTAGQRRRERERERERGGDAAAGGVKGFIRVSGNKFVDEGCGDFVPVGWNSELDGWQAAGGGARERGRQSARGLILRSAPSLRLTGWGGIEAGSIVPHSPATG